jgi:hypothetical protein
MRTASCFDGYDTLTVATMSSCLVCKVSYGRSLRRKSIVLGQELAVFAGEDVVCHGGYGESGSKVFAEREHKSRLSRSYRSEGVSFVLIATLTRIYHAEYVILAKQLCSCVDWVSWLTLQCQL